MTITVVLNGVPTTVEASLKLGDAVALWSPAESAVALAVNQQFVPRSEYGAYCLQDGDEIELLTPMQGG